MDALTLVGQAVSMTRREPAYVELGGRVVRETVDAPGFGTFAECADDQGVRFGLMER